MPEVPNPQDRSSRPSIADGPVFTKPREHRECLSSLLQNTAIPCHALPYHYLLFLSPSTNLIPCPDFYSCCVSGSYYALYRSSPRDSDSGSVFGLCCHSSYSCSYSLYRRDSDSCFSCYHSFRYDCGSGYDYRSSDSCSFSRFCRCRHCFPFLLRAPLPRPTYRSRRPRDSPWAPADPDPQAGSWGASSTDWLRRCGLL